MRSSGLPEKDGALLERVPGMAAGPVAELDIDEVGNGGARGGGEGGSEGS